jgi:acetyl-CoA carboxylase biotin carboxyl carrier protein
MQDITEYCSKHLPQLLKLIEGSDLRELVLQDGDWQIRVVREPGAPPVASVGHGELPEMEEPDPPAVQNVISPLVGTFYRAGEPGAPPLVAEGSVVDDNTVVGIVEAMHVLTEVEAGCAGVVSRVLATDGQPVEYGQVLFEVSDNRAYAATVEDLTSLARG